MDASATMLAVFLIAQPLGVLHLNFQLSVIFSFERAVGLEIAGFFET